MPQLASTSTAFTAAGNPLAPVLQRAADTLQRVAEAFPYEEADPEQERARHRFWFRTAANVDAAAPATVAAGAKGGGWSEAPTVPARVDAASAAADHVTTIDPAGSFTALHAARQKDAVGRGRAMDELCDVLLQLLRLSWKDAQYGKCDDGLRALRVCCVAEGEPGYYNSFLIKLSLLATELGHRESYWEPRMRAEKGAAAHRAGGVHEQHARR
ncbi:hypothetical protein STCU_11959 [Strigomonas culicis]|uniref:Ku C-terminal domain-containing protein n=1 Tax=Strigomonas culicis TaxID=28005 RepID=S9TBY8_9TRYP|nr:hypothetical protein STCU_11959 [Strigomonas culicis]|eukprot:EPY15517.1 hypothetical protein STCU_11959 [Strigomonas culicis]